MPITIDFFAASNSRLVTAKVESGDAYAITSPLTVNDGMDFFVYALSVQLRGTSSATNTCLPLP